VSRKDEELTTVANLLAFGDMLEAADRLSLEEQETLADILRRRIIQRRRREIALEVQAAREEHKAGTSAPATPGELMSEILA